MIHLIVLSFVTALFIQGFHYTMLPPEGNYPPEVFYFIRKYAEKILPKFFHKPFFLCPVCMSSVYGSLFYWSDIGIHSHVINSLTLVYWFVFCVVTAGIGRIMTKVIMG